MPESDTGSEPAGESWALVRWTCPLCDRSKIMLADESRIDPVERGLIGLKMHVTQSQTPGHGERGETADSILDDQQLREGVTMLGDTG